MSDSENDSSVDENVPLGENDEPEEVDKSVQYLNQSTQVISAIIFFLSALGTLFFRVVQLVAVFISWFFFIISISPYLFLVGVITVGAIPYVHYQDIIIEEVGKFERTLFTALIHP